MSRLLVSLADGDDQMTIFVTNEDHGRPGTCSVRRWKQGEPPSVDAKFPVSEAELKEIVNKSFADFYALAMVWGGQQKPAPEPEEVWDIE